MLRVWPKRKKIKVAKLKSMGRGDLLLRHHMVHGATVAVSDPVLTQRAVFLQFKYALPLGELVPSAAQPVEERSPPGVSNFIFERKLDCILFFLGFCIPMALKNTSLAENRNKLASRILYGPVWRKKAKTVLGGAPCICSISRRTTDSKIKT